MHVSQLHLNRQHVKNVIKGAVCKKSWFFSLVLNLLKSDALGLLDESATIPERPSSCDGSGTRLIPLSLSCMNYYIREWELVFTLKQSWWWFVPSVLGRSAAVTPHIDSIEVIHMENICILSKNLKQTYKKTVILEKIAWTSYVEEETSPCLVY